VTLILAIDDEPMRYERLLPALRDAGHTLLIAEGDCAMLYLRELPIAAVLLDWDLTCCDSMGWALALHRELPTMPVLVVSVNPEGRQAIAEATGAGWPELPATIPGWVERVVGWVRSDPKGPPSIPATTPVDKVGSMVALSVPHPPYLTRK